MHGSDIAMHEVILDGQQVPGQSGRHECLWYGVVDELLAQTSYSADI